MQFEVPYRIGRSARRYSPDFLVRIDWGGGEVLNLVLETKGYRGLDAQLKADTMRTLWVPGINNLGAYGIWAFAEFREVYAIQQEFGDLLDRFLTKELA
jgi:type III restriction enzyme